MTFSVSSSESGMPTGHQKLEKLSELLGKLWKSYKQVISKLSAALVPVYVNEKFSSDECHAEAIRCVWKSARLGGGVYARQKSSSSCEQ